MKTKNIVIISIGVAALIGGGLWLLLSKKGKSEDEVALEPSVPRPMNKTTGVIGTTFANGTYIAPQGTSANVRAEANTTSSVIENISSGKVIGKVISSTTVGGYIWTYVETLSGKKGYVRSDIAKQTQYSISDTEKYKYGTKVLANKDSVEVFDETGKQVITKISKYTLIGTVISVFQGGLISVNLSNPIILTYPVYKKYLTGVVKLSDVV